MIGCLLRAAATALQYLAMAHLRVGAAAAPILQASAWCLTKAHEWDPRLWARDGDERTEQEERRP